MGFDLALALSLGSMAIQAMIFKEEDSVTSNGCWEMLLEFKKARMARDAKCHCILWRSHLGGSNVHFKH